MSKPDRRALCSCPTCIAGWKEIAAYNRAKEWEKAQLRKRVQNPRVMGGWQREARMKVEYGGRNFLIDFQRGTVSFNGREAGSRDYTRCMLRDADRRIETGKGGYSFEALATGIAFRDSRDPDDREKGRKAALVHALRGLDQVLPVELSKERRAAFWAAYLGRKHQSPTVYVEFVQRGPNRNAVRVTWPKGEQHEVYARQIADAMRPLATNPGVELHVGSTC